MTKTKADSQTDQEAPRRRPRESRPGAMRDAFFVAYLVECADRSGLVGKTSAQILADARRRRIFRGSQPVIWLHSTLKRLAGEGVICYYDRLGKSYTSSRRLIGMHVLIRLANPSRLKEIIRALPSMRPEEDLIRRIDGMALRQGSAAEGGNGD